MLYKFLKSSYKSIYVVTNCSKERPGSIVNETLKDFDTNGYIKRIAF